MLRSSLLTVRSTSCVELLENRLFLGFDDGQWVVTVGETNCRQSASVSAYSYGTIAASQYGRVVDGPVTADGFEWYRVDWDNYSYSGADGWSAAGSTRFVSAPISAPSTNSPGDTSSPGPVIDDLTPTFSWDEVPNATGYELNVQNRDTGEFVLNEHFVSGGSRTSYTPTTALPAGARFVWDMRAINGNTASASYADNRYFQTKSAAVVPGKPTTMSPGDLTSPGSVVTDLTPKFTWQQASNATAYEINLRNVDTLVYVLDSVVVQGGSTTEYTLENPLPAGAKFKWDIRALNGDTPGSYSDDRYFQTQAATVAPVITEVNPAAPRATGLAQTFTITGSNFAANATVDLYEVTGSKWYLNRPVTAREGSTSITISPNFGTTAGEWKVRVNSGGAASNQFAFEVVAQPSVVGDGFDYPLGNRGYTGGVPVPMLEFPAGSFAETNVLYPNGATLSPVRDSRVRVGDWHNYQDVGAYYDAVGGVHTGEDWNHANGDTGAPVYAVSDGRVVKIALTGSTAASWGWTIILLHEMQNGSKYYSIYSHVTHDVNNAAGAVAATAASFRYQVGATVERGNIIARVGAITNGNHLHFEMREWVRDLSLGELYRDDNGKGYYSDQSGVLRTAGMSATQVAQAYALMRAEGIIDPSDFIDGHRPAVTQVGPLDINGTSGSDTITLNQVGSEYVWSVNGTQYRKATSLVSTVTINGLNGNNTITIGSSVAKGVKVLSGTGSDRITGGAGKDTIYGGDGNDILRGGGNSDVIRGDSGADIIYGDTGNDSLYGGYGNDTMYGGDSHDYMVGQEHDDLMYGQAGDDRMFGSSGNDRLYGGIGADSLTGDAGVNRLYGDAGVDTLVSTTGTDRLDGGLETDVMDCQADDEVLNA